MKTRALGGSGLTVSEIGLGGMYLSLHDRPSDEEGKKTIHAALDAGVTFIDTADVYCLGERDIGHNERLIARALRERPAAKAVVATKGGLERPGGAWTRNARPKHLREACDQSLKALGVERIDLYQLHSPDPAVPFEESIGALAALRSEGKIAHVGLSNVNVSEIDAARKIVPIVSVQNRWNPLDRTPETSGVLARCTKNGIAFLPYSPFGGAEGAKTLAKVGRLAEEAKKRGVSPHRLVLAWMLAKSPVVIPIPGARRVQSAVDSAKGGELELTERDVREIEGSFR
jgi:aryl-alcohol dehydrogenase-like predicted oxidoreductase